MIYKDKPTIVVNERKDSKMLIYSKTPPVDSLMAFTANLKFFPEAPPPKDDTNSK